MDILKKPRVLLFEALTLIISLLFLLLAVLKNPHSGNTYSTAVLPIIIGGCALIAFAGKSEDNNSLIIAFSFVFLSLAGTAFQSVIAYLNATKMLIINIISVLLALGAIVFYKYVLKSRVLISEKGYKFAVFAVGGLSAALYLYLLIFGTRVNGAKLWFTLGPISLQISEITKLLFLFNIVLIYNCEQDYKTRFIYGLSCVGMHVLFLAILGEYSTSLIMIATYIVTAFVFTKTRYAILLIIASVLLIGLAVGTLFLLYPLVQNADGALAEKIVYVYDRLTRANPDQQLRALQSIINGKLFGCNENYTIYLYSEEADFALANFAQHFGILMTIICIFFSAASNYFVYKASLNEKVRNSNEFKLALILSVAISIQMLINIGSNISLLPCSGIGYPFISAGGTQSMIMFIMALFMVDGTRATTRVEHNFSFKKLKPTKEEYYAIHEEN